MAKNCPIGKDLCLIERDKKKQETLNSLFAGLAKYWVESFPGPSRTLRTLFESVEFIHFCQICTFAVVMGNTGIKVEFLYRSI